MSKISRKFIISLACILILVITMSLFINNRFIEKYYLYNKKQEISQICTILSENPDKFTELATEYEKNEKILIFQVPNTSDNVAINTLLREAFLNKGLALTKYWLWEQDYKQAEIKGNQLRLYAQENLNYSLLVGYTHLGKEFVAVVMIIPNVEEMIGLINWMTAFIFGIATLLLIALFALLAHRLAKPIAQLEKAANRIADEDFCQVNIRTNDELQSLGESINSMSSHLAQSQKELKDKNTQMEMLLNSVSHDLKTPLSLIKAYLCGIQDGLDDGTFLEIAQKQTDRMELMIQRLLELSRWKQETYKEEIFDLSHEIFTLISEQKIALEKRSLTLKNLLPSELIIKGSKEGANIIITNLLTNSIKYALNGEILLQITKENNQALLSLSNKISKENNLDMENLWKPFYVGESSRNKELSGTGLGLSIVQTIAQKSGWECGAYIHEDNIYFTITFPLYIK